MLVGGTSGLVRGTALAVVTSLVISATAVLVTIREASDLSRDPGVLAVFSVVTAGFAFSAMCFHIFRVRAALKLQKAPIANEEIRSHLVFTDLILNRSTDVDSPGRP